MRKGINKIKICISLDIELYREIQKHCDNNDSKISTRINSVLKKNRGSFKC